MATRGFEHFTQADVTKRELARKAKPSKYRNVKMVVDGIVFDSKREAMRYQQLKSLEAAGEIANLELQPEYPIEINGVRVCIWRGDFRYQPVLSRHQAKDGLGHTLWFNNVGFPIVEDVKGFKTEIYRLKKKLVEAQYQITIREIQ